MIRSTLGRAVDVLQVLGAIAATPAFEALRASELFESARHEAYAARDEAFLEHAGAAQRAVYVARLLLGDGLLRRDSESASTPAPAATVARAEVIFVGDVLGGAVDSATFSPGLRARFAQADAVCMNWEAVVADSVQEIAPFVSRRGMRQLADHARGASGDWWSGFDDASARQVLALSRRPITNLANNHTLDAGAAGFERTAAWLRERGAEVTGATERAHVITLGPVRLGLVSLAYGSNRMDAGSPFARVEALDDDAWWARREPELRECTHRVAILHWGHEHEWLPIAAQLRTVARLRARGMQAVLGHHPHVVQPHRGDSGGWVSYSLGDFLGGDRTPWSRLGVAVAVRFYPDGTVRGTPLALAQSPSWQHAARVSLLSEAPGFERWLARTIEHRRGGGVPLFGARVS